MAAAAYRGCCKIYNDYDGIEHDYTRKQGLIYERIFLPPMADPQWFDRSALWNAVEETEQTKDSRLAREFNVALPVELNQEQWVELLEKFVQTSFVDLGMCADAVIHNANPLNPHAHIMVTIRPLDENGGWQAKSQKEYLCIRNGEERGFTAEEFRTAQKDGWEKQYLYKQGKKKVYLPPSKAESMGLKRTSKHPKSSKFGRQNPITAQWNSEPQLLNWRQEWQDRVNEALEAADRPERIDCRSFADRGIKEQPTIHEGPVARAMEKAGLISDRCELNRLIRADNQMLREINKKIAVLTKKLEENAVKTVDELAELLEGIRGDRLKLKFRQCINQEKRQTISQNIEILRPIFSEYHKIKVKITSVSERRKTAMQELKKLSPIQLIQRKKLNQEVQELSEELDDLKDQKLFLMRKARCETDAEMASAEKRIKLSEEGLSRLQEQEAAVRQKLDDVDEKYADIRKQVRSEDESEVTYARLMLRLESDAELEKQLAEEFGEKYVGKQFKELSRVNDTELGENGTEMARRQWKLKLEQSKLKAGERKQATRTVKHKSIEQEI